MLSLTYKCILSIPTLRYYYKAILCIDYGLYSRPNKHWIYMHLVQSYFEQLNWQWTFNSYMSHHESISTCWINSMKSHIFVTCYIPHSLGNNSKFRIDGFFNFKNPKYMEWAWFQESFLHKFMSLVKSSMIFHVNSFSQIFWFSRLYETLRILLYFCFLVERDTIVFSRV